MMRTNNEQLDSAFADQIAAEGDPSGILGQWIAAMVKFEASMSECLADIAAWCSDRPRSTMNGISVLMCIVALGFLNTSFEMRPEELWALQDSELLDHMHYMSQFPQWNGIQLRQLVVVFESAENDGNANILTTHMFDAMNKTTRELLGTVATDADAGLGSTADFDPVSFPDVCLRLPAALTDQGSMLASSPCFVYSFLEFWPPKFPCMDVPAEILGQIVEQISFNPFVAFAANGLKENGCSYLQALPSSSLIDSVDSVCSTPLPSSANLSIADICPESCGTCPTDGVSLNIDASRSVWSDINFQKLPSDPRVAEVMDHEAEMLALLCVDFPARLISGLTRQDGAKCETLLTQIRETAEMSVSEICNMNISAAVSAYSSSSADNSAPENNGALEEAAAPQDLGRFSLSSFCQATCRKTCGAPGQSATADAAGAENRAEVLSILNAVGPILRWDTQLLLGRPKFAPGGALMEATAVRLLVSLDCTKKPVEMCEAIEFKIMEALGAAEFWPPPYGRRPNPNRAVRDGLRVQYFSLAGQNREMLRAMLGALPLLGVSIAVISCYLAIALGKFGRQVRHSKICVGFAGCSVVGIASVFTFGICNGLGVMVTPISQVAPFLLLGIGVDDMFVIVRTLEQIPVSLTTKERIRFAYRRCGGAIAVTSFTDALAFATGATIKFPAMRAFCINAGVGVVVTFFLQITFMAAVITISDQALKGNPGWGDKKLRQLRLKVLPREAPYYEKPLSDLGMPTNVTKELFSKTLAPFIENGSKRAHWTVMGFFGLLGVFGACGAFRMVKGFPITDVFQYDSYVSQFLISQSKQFPDQSYPFFLVFRGVDYADPASREEMTKLQQQLQSLPEVHHNLTNWVDAYERSVYFDSWDNGLSPVRTFISSPEGVQYGLDLIWNDEGIPDTEGYCEGQTAGSCIIASRFLGYLPGDMAENSPLKTADAQEEIVKKIKAVTAKSSLSPAPFAFCFIMLVWEVWTELVVQMMTNLAQAFVAILLGCAIFLLHPLIALIVTLTVAVVELELAACCALLGINLNTVTVVIFIMNFGLVVDYSAHISHHFMTTSGSRRHRAAHALTDMGSGVFNGAFTTLLGMLPLYWAPFETGVVFVKLFGMIIFLGVLHAFILLPLLLASFGPRGLGSAGNHTKTTEVGEQTPPPHSVPPTSHFSSPLEATPHDGIASDL